MRRHAFRISLRRCYSNTGWNEVKPKKSTREEKRKAALELTKAIRKYLYPEKYTEEEVNATRTSFSSNTSNSRGNMEMSSDYSEVISISVSTKAKQWRRSLPIT